MRIKIASRKSDLARLQSYTVANLMKNKFPHIEVQFEFSSSFGDQNPDAPLWEMPAKGVFTEDFRDGLANEQFDMVVHSWKDLPSDMNTTSKIHTLERHDPRDLLLIKKSALKNAEESKKLSIFTSSPRREYHLEKSLARFLPCGINQLEFVTVRGNIATRLRKLIETDTNALVLAKAAIDRLLSAPQEEYEESKKELRSYLDQCHWIVLPTSLFPTAAAQGALAIETKRTNKEMHKILDTICDKETYENVVKEREVLKSYGGGCHQKIGINYTRYEFGTIKSLVGMGQQGEEVRDYCLLDTQKSNSAEFWPTSTETTPFFKKDFYPIEIPNRPLWISHESALPKNTPIERGQPIWCAGVKTWEKLAKRGYWVNGCCDSLGESIDQKLDQLTYGEKSWLKLTHEGGKQLSGVTTLSTYKLIASSDIPKFQNQKQFFWISGSQFLQALEINPHLIELEHSCGPGNTLETLKKHIPDNRISIALTLEQWLSDRT